MRAVRLYSTSKLFFSTLSVEWRLVFNSSLLLDNCNWFRPLLLTKSCKFPVFLWSISGVNKFKWADSWVFCMPLSLPQCAELDVTQRLDIAQMLFKLSCRSASWSLGHKGQFWQLLISMIDCHNLSSALVEVAKIYTEIQNSTNTIFETWNRKYGFLSSSTWASSYLSFRGKPHTWYQQLVNGLPLRKPMYA